MKKLGLVGILCFGFLLGACGKKEEHTKSDFDFVTTKTTVKELKEKLGQPDEIKDKKESIESIQFYQDMVYDWKQDVLNGIDTPEPLTIQQCDNFLLSGDKATDEKDLEGWIYHYNYENKEKGTEENRGITFFVNERVIVFIPGPSYYK